MVVYYSGDSSHDGRFTERGTESSKRVFDMMNSLEKLCQAIKCEAKETEPNPEWLHSIAYIVTLQYKRRKLTVPFYQGMAICKEPQAHDVIYCLISDAQSVENADSFEDWAFSLGYDTDSRKAEKIYKACVKNQQNIRRFLGTDFDKFAKACEDY